MKTCRENLEKELVLVISLALVPRQRDVLDEP